MVLGMVLGVMAESELRRSLIISHGSWSIFLTRPIAATLLALTLAVLLYPLLLGVLRRRGGDRAVAGPVTTPPAAQGRCHPRPCADRHKEDST
jgi:putative tricarboxylic transport membrane protein